MAAENILVIQTSFIGDAILTLPMLEKLKSLYPKSKLNVLTIPSTEIIFANSPFVDDVIIYDKRGKDKGLKNLLKLGKSLKDKKFTKLFSPHRSLRTAIIVLLSQVFDSNGFNNSSLPYVYKNIVEHKLHEHEVLRNFRLINYPVDGDNWKVMPKLNIPQQSQKLIADYIKENNISEYICISPGSVWETKKYLEKYYIEIIKYIVGIGLKVLIMGSSKEFEACENIKKEFSSNVINTAGKFSIIETIELIKNSKMVICNDSAPTHFAMAANSFVITLFCSTVPEFGFYPYSAKSSYLSVDSLSCKPCGIHGYNECPKNNYECAEKLYPYIVIDEIKNILEKTKK